MTDQILNYITSNWIEIVGSLLSLIYIFLSINQKVSLWIFGFLCSALYIVVFFQSKFYADMSLQFYYLGVSVYGWVSWKLGKQNTGADIPVKRTNMKQALVISLVAIALYMLYYYILAGFTDSPLPRADSLTTALSIVATWMLARKLIDHWLIWVFVDGLSAGLYFYKGLYPTAVLFVLYTIMAAIGYFKWRKSMVGSAKSHLR
ncbi:MAG: nicotinamide mononucleotide transporter PnuC [Bacteroidetes bacterium]|jgi:nicotinamide mononucleotide transporter|nr:nicotinamide mononucleotide transporter PnuC [Bacteroidota bacterium]